MKYFFDTEFIENGRTIDLISISIVSDDDRSLYLQNLGCDFSKASDWVWRNVFPSLAHFDMRGVRSCVGMSSLDSMSNAKQSRCDGACPWRTHYEIRDEVRQFCDPEKYGKPEFWGYYADYDWVALCQLFGTMVELPKRWPMCCRDVKQLCDAMGNPDLPKSKDSDAHHALSDALEIKMRYEWLLSRRETESPPDPRIKNLSNALRDAISTYGPKAEILVTEERQEAWKAVLRENGVESTRP